MGRLVDGKWSTQWYVPDSEGRFVRPETRFRARVSSEQGSAFTPQAGRYHLYVSHACPWAHRVMITRALLGLEEAIDVSVVDHYMDDQGWRFDPSVEGASADAVLGSEYLREVYTAADPKFSGRVTVPILWDRERETIVNNESREIVRMFSEGLAPLALRPVDLAPPALRPQIEAVIEAIYEPINNGVYKSGFATTQGAYDQAVAALFEGLDRWDDLLGRQRWLAGPQLSEADIFLFTTLLRFDLVYHTHFKCNRKRIVDYQNLWGFVRELYQLPGVAQTCNFEHITRHYFASHDSINPYRIVAVGPELDFDAAHDRARVGGESAAARLGLD